MSAKRAEASRKNGAKGQGPTSREGKDRSRMNAQQGGIYAREVVIEQLGERSEEYDRCRRAFRSSFEPANFVEEMLCDDAAENWWRRERVRRFEAARVRSAILELEFLPEVENPQRLDELRSKFLRLFRQKEVLSVQQNVRGGKRTIEEVDADMATVREQLHKTADGLRYIRSLIADFKREAELRGQLSEISERFLYACVGEGDEFAQACIVASRYMRKEARERDTAKPASATNKTEEVKAAERSIDEDFLESNRQMLVLALDSIDSRLTLQQSILEGLDRAKKEIERGAAAMQVSEKLSHAETRYDRQLYKAYATLYTLKFQQARMAIALEAIPQLPREGGLP